MSNKGIITFICYFLVVIYIVPVVQAVVEYRGGDSSNDKNVGIVEKISRIQPFDFFTDTFVTPVKRTNDVANSLDALSVAIADARKEIAKAVQKVSDDSNVNDLWYDTDAESKFSDVIVSVKKSLKSAKFINRHIEASEKDPLVSALSDIDEKLDIMSERIGVDLDFSEADKFLADCGDKVKQLSADNPARSGVLASLSLAANAFFTSTAFSSKYIHAYESEMEDSSIFANTVRPWMQFAQYLFVRDTGPKAIAGKDGWLFFKPGFDYLVNPSIYDSRSKDVDANDGTNKAFTDDPIAAMVDFRDQLKERGIDLLVVPVPGKLSIYPDKLSDACTENDAGTISHSLALIKQMREAGIETVDLFTPLAQERKKDSKTNTSLYLRTDTHWRTRGLRKAAQIVSERVKQYPWFKDINSNIELTLAKKKVMRDGDIGIMTKLPDLKLRDIEMSFPLEPVNCYQVEQVWRNDSGEIARTKPYNTIRMTMKSDILVIGDSFSRIYQDDAPKAAGWTSHLAYDLGVPVGLIYSDGGASTLVRQRLARKVIEKEKKGKKSVLTGKKLLIWEFVERDFRFGAKGWKQVSLKPGV